MARVLLFGRLRDVAGWRERQIEPAPATLSALQGPARRRGRRRWARPWPGRACRWRVDQVIVRGDAPLRAGAEVAFLPPMSGG